MASADPLITAVGTGASPAALRRSLLGELYAPEVAERVAVEAEQLLRRHRPSAGRSDLWDEHDAWLITYPDQFTRPGEAPLATLGSVMQELFQPWLNGLHVTPFFPWTSDDGFAVTDYLAVDERYGDWQDVEALARGRRLVIDAVINHLSARSGWFQRFLAGDPAYRGFFRTADPATDLSATVRPRARPLLTAFEGAEGPVWAWTTFSPDQVDLDYRTPEVLLRVLEVLLAYLVRGVGVLRLDAVAFLWKQEGTSSMHLAQTHAVIQFLRSCVESVEPSVLVLTETNVPSHENVSYFGTGEVAEAHLVYQFPLPALTLHALLTEDASRLSAWAAGAEPPHPGTSFLNFLASHDGVGVRPAEGLLDSADTGLLADAVLRGGGEITRRELPDGDTAVYELNSTWYSALAGGPSEEEALTRSCSPCGGSRRSTCSRSWRATTTAGASPKRESRGRSTAGDSTTSMPSAPPWPVRRRARGPRGAPFAGCWSGGPPRRPFTPTAPRSCWIARPSSSRWSARRPVVSGRGSTSTSRESRRARPCRIRSGPTSPGARRPRAWRWRRGRRCGCAAVRRRARPRRGQTKPPPPRPPPPRPSSGRGRPAPAPPCAVRPTAACRSGRKGPEPPGWEP
jgi:hypothetical protein